MLAKEFLANPDPAIQHCHCPSITITPAGDLFVVWYAYPKEETRNAVLVLARKRAGQKRFDPPRRILNHMNSSLGNPVIFCDSLQRLQLLFVTLQGQYWDSAVANACHSGDLGQTWTAHESMRLGRGIMVRHAPIARNNDDFILPAYDEETSQTVLLTTGPNVGDWSVIGQCNGSQAIQGDIVRLSDSELCMILRPVSPNRTCMRSLSHNDGKNWSPLIPTTLPSALSGVAAFKTDDTLCAVYNHTTEHRRYPLSLSYSNDLGTTWNGPKHIDETEHELSYPSFIVDQRGVVHGVYTFGRSRIRYVSFDSTWWTD